MQIRNTIIALSVLVISSFQGQARPLRVAFVADPQVDNELELSYARRSVYKELRERKDLDFVIVLGDLVNDKPDLLADSAATLDSLSYPWFAVPGNHDRDWPGRPRTLERYREEVGAPDTAFVVKSVRFILMNNVRTLERGDYEAGLTNQQKIWLEARMKEKGNFKQTVLSTHIPFSSSSAQALDSLKSIIGDCPNLLLVCGHMHNVNRESLEIGPRRIEEITAGSACGTWWRGNKAEDGIPYALQNCGAPRGYFVIDFRKSDYSLSYCPIGKDKKEYSLNIVDDKDLVVNVFGGSKEASVRLKINGTWYDAKPYDSPAPEVQRVMDEQEITMTREYRRQHRDLFIPMRKLASPHVWYVRLENPVQEALKVKLDYRDNAMRIKRSDMVKKLK